MAARMIYHAVHAGRALLGRTDQEIVVRDNINFSEGIDFGIYLGNFYERQTRAALTKLVSSASLVLDIGANIGAHTLHLAQLVGALGKSWLSNRPNLRSASFDATSTPTRRLPPECGCSIASSPPMTA
jgi:hypothetical protein